ncbi:MAG: hypothetical protein H6740_07930 [Alphaproteobacteria bacterium]|nr:hypothetical protein [Alphaproteobacteria bacterium]
MTRPPSLLALALTPALLLLGLVLELEGPWGPAPAAQITLRLVDEAGAPVQGEVAARCWHAHLDPSTTELRATTDAEGRVTLVSPGCQALEAYGLAPGRLPGGRLVGPGDAELSLPLLPQPPWDGTQLRAAGWAGREAAGATLQVVRHPDGREQRFGWDLLGDRPAADPSQADIWPGEEDGGEVSIVAPPGLDRVRIGLPRVETDRPWLWHTSCALGEAGPIPGPGAPVCVRPRSGEAVALLLSAGPVQRSARCPDGGEGCEVQTWTFDAFVDPSGRGQLHHGLRPRLEALLLLQDSDAFTLTAPLLERLIPEEGS